MQQKFNLRLNLKTKKDRIVNELYFLTKFVTENIVKFYIKIKIFCNVSPKTIMNIK